MGLTDIFSSRVGPPVPKISSDGAPIAPDRTQRAKCWEARDVYFRCLDKNQIIDSIKEGGKAAKVCGNESKEFEANCASSWVCASFAWEKGRSSGMCLMAALGST